MNKLENMTREQLIKLVLELEKNQKTEINNYNYEYEEKRLEEEINQYDAHLEKIDYIDYGYGVGCYGSY